MKPRERKRIQAKTVLVVMYDFTSAGAGNYYLRLLLLLMSELLLVGTVSAVIDHEKWMLRMCVYVSSMTTRCLPKGV